MRKLRFAVLCLTVLTALVCVTAGACAETSGKCGDNITCVLDDDGVLIISGTGAMYYEYNMPWSNVRDSIFSIIIGDGVTNIADYAFSGCSNLTSVTIPDSVTSIGIEAFLGCSSLTSVTIPDSVTSIEQGAFRDCSSLTSVTIPDSVTSIEHWVFWNCSSLTSVTIPDSVTSIGIDAFFGCSSLTSVTIPDSVTSIEQSAFCNCSSLTSVTIPDSVISTGTGMFCNCSSLTSVTIPDSWTGIADEAFFGCSSLTSVTIPDSVIYIGDYAFEGCCNLTSVTIPDSVKGIGLCAFSGCSSLGKITILGDTVDFDMDVFSYPGPTIYCYRNTNVDDWATQKGYSVFYLDEYLNDANLKIVLEPDFRLARGNSKKLSIDIFPEQLKVTWTSSNPAIVCVKSRTVTALSNGIATITATIGNVSASVNIQVFTSATGFTLSETEAWLIAKEGLQLSVTAFEPADASAELTWSSSDTSLATVSGNGQVTTYKPGDVTITAVTEQGVSQECLIHICYSVTDIAFADDTVSISQGNAAQLTANVTMQTQSCVNHLVTFSSSDETVATVSETGVVTARALGTATITAAAASGVSAECTVTVRALNILALPASTVTIENEAFANLPGVDRIVIPATVTSIADDAFSGSNITIVAPVNSYAAEWATEHGIPCMIQ